jgi:hypothetical protein
MDAFVVKQPSVDADAHEIVPGIYLGNFRVASNHTLLRVMGVTHVLNAAIEHPNYFENKGITYKYLPLYDHPGQNIAQHFRDGFEFIDNALQTGGKVLVHCHAGISRSTTMLTSYLMKKYGKTPKEVLTHIKGIRRIIQPNSGFVSQLLDFGKAPSAPPMPQSTFPIDSLSLDSFMQPMPFLMDEDFQTALQESFRQSTPI